jgi:hypothetical protein
MIYIFWGLLFTLTFSQDLSGRINKIAIESFTNDNLTTKNDSVFLYKTLTNGENTNFGKWACAKVTSIILQKAGAIKKQRLGVNQIEKDIQNWTKITNPDSLKPGDVIIFYRIINGNSDKSCTGGGTCHIGIFTEKGIFHNSPLAKRPTFDGISLYVFKFNYALRAPK